ncbi:MAG: DUF6103 family protein [Christensenellaceae bacterium]|jgi:hypothetical protein|nr:MAG: hypothetical protein DBY05_05995 [Clostridiales bacterium]
MKKTTLTISFDEEKLSAMKMYLEQKQQTIEGELEKSLDALYAKTVPAVVREFLDLRAGIAMPAQQPKPRKAKPSPLSVVGGATPEEKPHD